MGKGEEDAMGFNQETIEEIQKLQYLSFFLHLSKNLDDVLPKNYEFL